MFEGRLGMLQLCCGSLVIVSIDSSYLMADFTPQFSSIRLLADVDAFSYHINHTVCFKHVCSLMFMGIRIDLIIHKRTAHFHMIEIIFNLIKMRFHVFVLFLSFSLGIYVPHGLVRKSNVFRRLSRVLKMDQKGTKKI